MRRRIIGLLLGLTHRKSLLLAPLVAAFFLIPTQPSAIGLGNAAQTTYLYDDFNAGLGNWTTPQAGTWTVVNGALYGQTEGTSAIATTTDRLSDYTVEVRAKSTSRCYQVAGYTLLLRRQGNNDGYGLRFGNCDALDQMWLVKFATGYSKVTELAPPVRIGVNADKWHVLRVSLAGARIEVFLNSGKVLEVSDSSYPAGGVGLLLHKGDWYSGGHQVYYNDAPSFFDYVLVAPVITSDGPQPQTPASGAVLTSFGPTLSWQNPGEASLAHLLVTPANNDGPGVDVFVKAKDSFTLPAPPQWYGLLPDMTYTWKVRTTMGELEMTAGDPSWGPWSQPRTFRTPKATSDTITPASPSDGSSVNSRTPSLTWSNSNPAVFYYEVQVSKDSNFGPNAFLYWELVHGGASSPPNSYAIPSKYPLEPKTAYYWRVRPRIQGDGTPSAWSQAWSFRTP